MTASGDLSVVGAYPDGRAWDLIRADGASDDDVRRSIAAIGRVPVPQRDPVTGAPMADVWRRPG